MLSFWEKIVQGVWFPRSSWARRLTRWPARRLTMWSRKKPRSHFSSVHESKNVASEFFLKLLHNIIYSCIRGNFFAYSSCDSLTCPKINAPPSHIYVNPKVPYLSIFTLTVTISSLQPLQSLEHFADLLFLNRQCGNIHLGSYGTTGPSKTRV